MAPLEVKLTDNFLKPYYRLVCDEVIPYQWDALNDLIADAPKSYAIENIRIAAGLAQGEFGGLVFQDSDVAKWLEAVGYCIQNGDGGDWEAIADKVIALIAKAQQPDGYFNTYYQLTHPELRFTNLEQNHELYCLGHFIEAAVAYHQATGNSEILEIFRKYVDLVENTFGDQPGQRLGYPGHQEIELALAKLYELTGEERYLKLAQYFLNERGLEPNFFIAEAADRKAKGIPQFWEGHDPKPAYSQSHKPVREQTEAVGHAVRALYMYTGMAEVGRLTGDQSLIAACERLFQDVCRQMYVTGGVGSTHVGEAFTVAYDLPNEINYSETCASIALVLFMHAMLKIHPKAEYANVMERALYNTVLASMATDGRSYFYVNPMEVVPKFNATNPDRDHVKATRQKWLGCACCPPNVARLLASITKYLYTVEAETNTIYLHLYAGSRVSTEVAAGQVKFDVRTDYPLHGEIALVIESAPAEPITFALRIPDWNEGATFMLNGNSITPEQSDGYAQLTRTFSPGDVLTAKFEMTPRFVYANTQITADAGKVCVQRGPIIYCLEEQDNGSNLHALVADITAQFTERESEIGGMKCVELSLPGKREVTNDDAIYTFTPKLTEKVNLTFVPYYLWGNRNPGEMLVWLRH